MVAWYLVNSTDFHAGTKSSDALYFLSDTQELYRGSVSYGKSVYGYTGDLPESPATEKLYVNTATLESHYWSGTAWVQVSKPVDTTFSSSSTNLVTSAAIANYVSDAISTALSSSGLTDGVVTGVTYDSTTKYITVTSGDESTTGFTVDGVGCSLTYTNDAATGMGLIQLVDASGNSIGDAIEIDMERFVASSSFDPETGMISISFNNDDVIITGDYDTDNMPEEANEGDYVSISGAWYVYDGSEWVASSVAPQVPLQIDVSALIDTYSVTSTATVTMSMDNNVISADVAISEGDDNALTAASDGLYVAPTDLSGLMEKQASATSGNIATFAADGSVVDSGVSAANAGAVAVYEGTSITAAVGDATPSNGDYCIVSTNIDENGTAVERTAYVYDGSNWHAFTGNVSADNVYFASDLSTTVSIGNITVGSSGQETIAAAGKSLVDVLNTILVEEKYPTTTQPNVTISASNNKAYEVGNTVTPSYVGAITTGSYTYGPATGVVATDWSATNNTTAEALATQTGSFAEIVVGDTTSYKITVSANYTAGTTPVTNVGNDYPSGQIVAGTDSATTSTAISGYRCGFYGTGTDNAVEITNTVIRALAGKTTSAPTAGTVWSISLPVGTTRVIFAYPATLRDVSSVVHVGGMNAVVTTAFTCTTLDVSGANSYTPISYKVWTTDFATALTAADTYTVTI